MNSHTVGIRNATDFSPFGVELKGRNFEVVGGGNYRFGFNGQESIDEVSGDKNSYDFGARMYNPRLARFMSRDNFEANFVYQSPYSFAGNMPICAKDVNGDSVLFFSQRGKYLGYSNDNTKYKNQNLLVIIGDEHLKGFFHSYHKIRCMKKVTPQYKEARIALLESRGTTYDVTEIKRFYNKYYDKKLENPSNPDSKEIKVADPDLYVEWGADMESAENPIFKGNFNWVKINFETSCTVNSVNNCFPEGGDKGIAHLHTPYLGLHPSDEDMTQLQALTSNTGQQWQPIVNGNQIGFNSYEVGENGKIKGDMINITIDFQKFEEVTND